MKNSIRGALFSGLVFPGLGQIVLQRYLRGAIIVLTVLISLSIIVMKTVANALAIVDKIESENGMINLSKISETATQMSTTSADLLLNSLLIMLLICWVFGTVDAYRIGRKIDAGESAAILES